MSYYLYKSPRAEKKWMIITPSGKRVHFGAEGMSDYTKHHDHARMLRYVRRHGGTVSNGRPSATSRKENWTKSGMGTPGFWSRWLTWNKPSLADSIRDIERRFKVKIVRKK